MDGWGRVTFTRLWLNFSEISIGDKGIWFCLFFLYLHLVTWISQALLNLLETAVLVIQIVSFKIRNQLQRASLKVKNDHRSKFSIILHFHLQPQFKYELCHISFALELHWIKPKLTDFIRNVQDLRYCTAFISSASGRAWWRLQPFWTLEFIWLNSCP